MEGGNKEPGMGGGVPGGIWGAVGSQPKQNYPSKETLTVGGFGIQSGKSMYRRAPRCADHFSNAFIENARNYVELWRYEAFYIKDAPRCADHFITESAPFAGV